ncbi:MAG TPA: YHYH protein [Verrucomicrobiae bacterium]|nr:YHYH protein [Verrucomicrobiae bacterium]
MPKSARSTPSALLALLVALSGCSATGSPGLPGSAAGASSLALGSLGAVSAQAYTCPAAQTSSGSLNCAALALGDRKFSTTAPRAGYVYSCIALSGSPVVSSAPWLDAAAGTWDALTKDVVEGSVTWAGSFAAKVGASTTTVSGNELPLSYAPTGTFPISKSDPAYAYDHNPNHIASHTLDASLPSTPAEAKKPSCLAPGTIGVALNGVAIYDGFDAAGYDAVAREIQDGCHGHPDSSDTYHYHGWLQACVPDAGSATQNSSLLGYALDGYGIYGPWYGGKVLTTADLDECHGTTSPVLWNGKIVTIYHYVSTYDFPYTLGCYRGTPVHLKA